MENREYKYYISSKRKVFDLHLRETFRYRDLIFLFVRRDFTALYKQTILGPAWAIIQPLLTTVVFTIIFGGLAHLTTSDIEGELKIPGFLFYMSGNICWTYFSTTLIGTSNTFLTNRSIMGKVYYPRLVNPISTAISNLIAFFIQLIMFMCFLIYFLFEGNYSITISSKFLFLPLVIFQLIILSTGCGIIISSITTKYRDLAMLVGFGLQLWQYGSPIAYGLQLVPDRFLNIYLLNPVTPIITTFRYAVFGIGYFNLTYYLLSWLISISIFIIGLILFSKIESTFMDTI